MNGSSKFRAINTSPKGDVAQQRKQLYKDALVKIDAALKAGYFLEAIAICESILADRLEARLAWINGQKEDKRKYSTVGRLADELKGEKSCECDDAKKLYAKVKAWAEVRNEAIHQMVKLSETNPETWENKYRAAETTAKDGLMLFRDIDRLVRKLNMPLKPVTL